MVDLKIWPRGSGKTREDLIISLVMVDLKIWPRGSGKTREIIKTSESLLEMNVIMKDLKLKQEFEPLIIVPTWRYRELLYPKTLHPYIYVRKMETLDADLRALSNIKKDIFVLIDEVFEDISPLHAYIFLNKVNEIFDRVCAYTTDETGLFSNKEEV